MTSLSQEYIRLLKNFKKASFVELKKAHTLFWNSNQKDIIRDFTSDDFFAFHLGIISSELDGSFSKNWFFHPEINLNRIGLYADVIIFEDIVGSILNKKYLSVNTSIVEAQLGDAINKLINLKDWVDFGIVKIFPNEIFLGNSISHNFNNLLKLSLEEASTSLAEDIVEDLTENQRKALSFSGGHSLIHKTNKAILLKDLFGFEPSADDDFFKVLCKKLNWESQFLNEARNLYILKKVGVNYLPNSSKLVLELRKEDAVFKIRKFFREEMKSFFDSKALEDINSSYIKQFSDHLKILMHEADDELKQQKRKFGSDLFYDFSVTSTMIGITAAIDFGPQIAAWIPKVLPFAYGSKSILDSIKNHINKSKEIKRKPTFILGSSKYRKHE